MKAENETATRNERREQKIDYRNLRSTALNKSANLEQVKLTEKVQELKKPGIGIVKPRVGYWYC